MCGVTRSSSTKLSASKPLSAPSVTGLTIGYGDFVPHRPLTQALSVMIGFLGIVLIGLVSALAVKAFQLSSETQPHKAH